MSTPTSGEQAAEKLLSERLVRYGDLIPCTTAFIDTRTPGSAKKENFTIIGPGVAENPDQHVHISIPHGFNIGAARQPPGCVNSQHSHETAEVFVVHTGRWAFYLGPDAGDGEVILEPGDTISIPIHVFRGFENVGDDTGFMFAVLGGDDPGHVTWAPYVFESAKQHGLILLENGSLVDTTKGESVPAGKKPMPVTTEDDVRRLRQMTADQLQECVARYVDFAAATDGANRVTGLIELPVIGSASATEKLPAGRMNWPHGFHLRYCKAAPGARGQWHRRSEEEVILVHKGTLDVSLGEASTQLKPGDTMTIPIDAARRFENSGDVDVEIYVVRGGDAPSPPVSE